jgi:hypothetical protein
MVADPFTIAGAFGLAAGLTSFVASTVEKTAGQIDTARHAHERLRVYQIALKTCQRRLEAWARQWYGHEGSMGEDLRSLWGPEGLEEIENLKLIIVEEQECVLGLLYGRRWLRLCGRDASARWEMILRGQEDALRQNRPAPALPMDSSSRDFYIRIQTALWNNNLLSASVDRMKRLVDDLETTSRLRFHEVQRSGDHHRQPSTEEIGSIIRQRRRMQLLTQALLVAYQNLRHPAGSCGLLFMNFDKVEMCRLAGQDELAVTFLIVSTITCDFFLY